MADISRLGNAPGEHRFPPQLTVEVLLLLARYIQMSREGLFIVQCRTHTAAPVPPLSLWPAIVGSSTEGHRWESQKPPCPPSQNGIYLSMASVVRYHDGRG